MTERVQLHFDGIYNPRSELYLTTWIELLNPTRTSSGCVSSEVKSFSLYLGEERSSCKQLFELKCCWFSFRHSPFVVGQPRWKCLSSCGMLVSRQEINLLDSLTGSFVSYSSCLNRMLVNIHLPSS